MRITTDYSEHVKDIAVLCETVFTESDGPEEGQLVGTLARDLLADTDPADLRVYLAMEKERIDGCIMFSRIGYEGDARVVFVLAPVAVRTSKQKQGIGLKMLRYGLEDIRGQGADIALTYGDPKYYCKVGFVPITAANATPPHKLNMPFGWLGQSLVGEGFEPLVGPARTVSALDAPEYW